MLSSDFQYLGHLRELYFNTWEARKIIEIPVTDALRNSYVITSDAAEELKAQGKRLNLDSQIREALILERLDGGCGIFIDYSDGEENLQSPPTGEIVGFTVIPRDYISFQNMEVDVFENDTQVYISGKEIHPERILLLRGSDPKAIVKCFSNSVLTPISKDIERARDIRELIYRLAKKSSIIIASVDMLSLADEEKLFQIRKSLTYMSNDQSIVVDGQNLKIHEYTSSFGALPELMQSYLKVLASSLDVPVTRFLGTSNSGLTQSADGDLENYYNMLQGYQTSHIIPILTRLYTQIGTSFNFKTDDMLITFPPLWNDTDEEIARTNEINLNKVIRALEAGLITREEAISELNFCKVFNEKIGDAKIGNLNNDN